MVKIVDVWDSNLDKAFDSIVASVESGASLVAADSEYPGVVVKRRYNRFNPEEKYLFIKENVERVKIIQLGLSLRENDDLDETGNRGRENAWEFNFRGFDRTRDEHAEDSINLLVASGIDFERNIREGIDPDRFIGKLLCSGLLATPRVTWAVFQGEHDVAFLVKMLLRNRPLPKSRIDFLSLVKKFFPRLYDIRELLPESSEVKTRSLEDVAEKYSCERIGTSHRAGSDSLLTLSTFIQVNNRDFHGLIPDTYAGKFINL